jgi:hypothetical protein
VPDPDGEWLHRSLAEAALAAALPPPTLALPPAPPPSFLHLAGGASGDALIDAALARWRSDAPLVPAVARGAAPAPGDEARALALLCGLPRGLLPAFLAARVAQHCVRARARAQARAGPAAEGVAAAADGCSAVAGADDAAAVATQAALLLLLHDPDGARAPAGDRIGGAELVFEVERAVRGVLADEAPSMTTC